MIALITGGSGCGKSHFAERLTVRIAEGPLYYIATMPVVDEECAKRVARHRALRAGKGFITAERQTLVGLTLPEGATALLECVPTLLSDEMFFGGDEKRVAPEIIRLARACQNLVLVTNEVGADGVTYDRETAAYIARLAQINRALAEIADVVCEVVYSIPLCVKGALPCAL